jgi:hypothetical protein
MHRRGLATTGLGLGLALALAAAAAGCGFSGAGDAAPAGDDGGGGSGGDPGVTCSAAVQPDVPLPTAGPTSAVHAVAKVTGASGVLDYAWQVSFNGATVAFSSPQPSVIDFAVPVAGIYVVTLTIGDASNHCPTVVAPISIAAPGAMVERWRLRVVPPQSAPVPAMERLLDVKGGGDADLGILTLDEGSVATPAVLGPTGGLAAYLQFTPAGLTGPGIEAFSNGFGAASVRLVTQIYSVLVVPSGTDVAPRRLAGWTPGNGISLDAGIAVSGTVHGPGPAALEGATVRLISDGVPSTTATTQTGGSFALRAAPGTAITVEVTPPVASGLPRLIATSQSFQLGMSLEVQYASNPAPVDLGGTAVRRTTTPVSATTTPLPGARLTFTGSLPAVGQVTTGSTQVIASGDVRITATADGAGVLPAIKVPPLKLSTVVDAGLGDLSVVEVDATQGAPAAIEAPAMQLITTAALDAGGGALAGATLDLVPLGPLAIATAPTLRRTATAGGAIAVTLPTGGRYQLRFTDPKGRGAPVVVDSTLITAIAPSYALPRAIQIQGTLRRDSAIPIAGASVQLLCDACTGIAHDLPLAEVVSDATGRFALAVKDPGTR